MARKLGIREGSRVLVLRAPAGLSVGELDVDFQGLQFVYRLRDRPAR